MTSTKNSIKAGERIHFLGSLTVIVSRDWLTGGEVTRRGQVVTVTDAMLEANRDRNGDSWLDLIDSPESQIERYGAVFFGRGDFPKSESVFVSGSLEHARERDRRNTAAWANADEIQRGAELRKIQAEFGPVQTSQTSQAISGDYEK